MTVITKTLRDKYKKEIDSRYEVILDILTNTAELKDSREGIKGPRHWVNIEQLCKLDTISLKLAIGDFKVILTELSKIK